jgi:hypothetical protein
MACNKIHLEFLTFWKTRNPGIPRGRRRPPNHG